MSSVSVAAIVPVFNRPKAVLEALDGVRAQTCPPAKVIVVDDGSTDDTVARVEEWMANNRPPFEAKVIRQTNAGAAAARNRGVEEARECEVYAFLDSDDIWPADYLRRVSDAFAAHPDAVGACADRVNHDFATGAVHPHRYTHYADGKRNATTIMFAEGPPGTSGVAIRASAFHKVGGFDSAWPTGQDYDLMLRVSLLGRWLYVPGSPITSRNHLEVLTGGGEPPLSLKYADRAFRRVQMLDQFIHQAGGIAVVPDSVWRPRLVEFWYRAGRKLLALKRPEDAARCFRRTLEFRPGHLRARVRLLFCGGK